MSQENVEIVRRAYESFNAGQDESMSAFHPNVEVTLSGVFPVLEAAGLSEWAMSQETWRPSTPLIEAMASRGGSPRAVTMRT